MSKPRTLFTADLHLGHHRIRDYCSRPFASVGEMDAALIANWNAVATPDTDVWVLGDFCWGEDADRYLDRLLGRKHLIWGNHDYEEVRSAKGWTSSQPYAEIMVDGQQLVLFHYAMRVWFKSSKGSYAFFGHSHGNLLGDSRSCDVGVDVFGYKPVDLAEIRRKMRTQPDRGPEPDHHGRRRNKTERQERFFSK